jgi:hypothetical protein
MLLERFFCPILLLPILLFLTNRLNEYSIALLRITVARMLGSRDLTIAYLIPHLSRSLTL